MKIREMLYKSGFCMKIREMPADIKVQCQKVGKLSEFIKSLHIGAILRVLNICYQDMMVFNI